MVWELLLLAQTATVVAELQNPFGLAMGPDGALYVGEVDAHRIARIDLRTRAVETYAGGLNEPYELRFDRRGDLYFVDMKAHRVGRIERATRKLHWVAGTGEAGFSGDGGWAVEARLRQPHSLAFLADGSLLICDIGNHRIRRIGHDGRIETWAGTGEKTAFVDGTPRRGGALLGPRAVEVAPDGTVYLALREGNAILRLEHETDSWRKLAPSATWHGPKGIAWSRDGGLYVADTESHEVRRLDLRRGTVARIAGDLQRPHGVFVSGPGDLYIGDSENNRVLVVGKRAIERLLRGGARR